VYAIDANMDTTYVALGAVCKMTPMEKIHLYFSHCISEDKLMHMSKNKVPGIPPGLKRMDIPCSANEVFIEFHRDRNGYISILG